MPGRAVMLPKRKSSETGTNSRPQTFINFSTPWRTGDFLTTVLYNWERVAVEAGKCPNNCHHPCRENEPATHLLVCDFERALHKILKLLLGLGQRFPLMKKAHLIIRHSIKRFHKEGWQPYLLGCRWQFVLNLGQRGRFRRAGLGFIFSWSRCLEKNIGGR